MANSEPLNSTLHQLIAAFFGLFVFILSIDSVLAGTFTASVDRTEIVMGEPFNLTLSIDSNHSSTSPDLSPLLKDFNIVSTSQSSQTQVINGNRTDSFSWIVTLTAKTEGKQQIPALSYDQLKSQPISIEILNASAAPTKNQSHPQLSINVDIDSDSHYIHEEIPMTVTIIDGVGIKSATLSDYSGDDFIIKQAGDDEVKQVNRNGRLVNEIKRNYLVKPQKSGTLTFPALTLNARINDSRAGNGIFGNDHISRLFNQFGAGSSVFDDFFNPGRAVSITSKPIDITIKERPTANDEWFLPARDVQILGSFNTDIPQFKTGEAVTRTIQLFALGASVEQLPEITFESTDGVTVYVDKTDTQSSSTEDGTAVIKEYVTSVIPSRAGEITLPAIKVKWWDTESDTEKVATLAAQTFTVEGPAQTIPVNDSQAVQDATDQPAVKDNITQRPDVSEPGEKPGLNTIVSLVAALIMIAILLYFMKRSQGRSADSYSQNSDHHKPQLHPLTHNESSLIRDIESASQNNNLPKAYTATLNWLSVLKDSNSNTQPCPANIISAIEDELLTMENCLYSDQHGQSWTGQTLLNLIKQYKKSARKSKSVQRANTLQPLYPISNAKHNFS